MEGTPQQPSVPAGWYPDPNGQGQRYWDGAAWTEHTAPAAEAVSTGATTEAAGASAAAQGEASAARPAQSGTPQPAGVADPHAPHAAVAGASGDQPGTLEWALSVLLPLVPIAGLIWGVYLKRQGPAMENPANLAIVLSLVVILVAVLLFR